MTIFNVALTAILVLGLPLYFAWVARRISEGWTTGKMYGAKQFIDKHGRAY